MACYSPLEAWRSTKKTRTGKLGITFKREESAGIPVELPCGRCIGCRLDKSREWAIRMVHEAQLHRENSFITLTYNDEHLPANLSLNKRHFQLFMKRLRKRFNEKRIRFYHCGEYGESDTERLGRPHYHALLFGHDFDDKEFFREREGTVLYTSPTLQELWPKGFSTVGEVTWQSAAYAARYVTKKITGDMAEDVYFKICPRTGELKKVIPEYATMSRNKGIGNEWFKKYKEDVFPSDFIVHGASKYGVPRYYSSIYEVEEPEKYERIAKARRKRQKALKKDSTPERLAVRHVCKLKQAERLKREL